MKIINLRAFLKKTLSPSFQNNSVTGTLWLQCVPSIVTYPGSLRVCPKSVTVRPQRMAKSRGAWGHHHLQVSPPNFTPSKLGNISLFPFIVDELKS